MHRVYCDVSLKHKIYNSFPFHNDIIVFIYRDEVRSGNREALFRQRFDPPEPNANGVSMHCQEQGLELEHGEEECNGQERVQIKQRPVLEKSIEESPELEEGTVQTNGQIRGQEAETQEGISFPLYDNGGGRKEVDMVNQEIVANGQEMSWVETELGRRRGLRLRQRQEQGQRQPLQGDMSRAQWLGFTNTGSETILLKCASIQLPDPHIGSHTASAPPNNFRPSQFKMSSRHDINPATELLQFAEKETFI